MVRYRLPKRYLMKRKEIDNDILDLNVLLASSKECGIMSLMAKAAAVRGRAVRAKSVPGTLPTTKKAARQSPQALPDGRCLIG